MEEDMVMPESSFHLRSDPHQLWQLVGVGLRWDPTMVLNRPSLSLTIGYDRALHRDLAFDFAGPQSGILFIPFTPPFRVPPATTIQGYVNHEIEVTLRIQKKPRL